MNKKIGEIIVDIIFNIIEGVKGFFIWIDLDYYIFSVIVRYILIIGGAIVGNFIKNNFFHYNYMWFSKDVIDFGILNNACNFMARTLFDASGFIIGGLSGYIIYFILAHVIAIPVYIIYIINEPKEMALEDKAKLCTGADDCSKCKNSESIDGRGYYWCKKIKKSFKIK